MDWPDQKRKYQKQPPDKKNKPKYVAKDQIQGQQPTKAGQKLAVPEAPTRKYNNNNQQYNRKSQQGPKQEEIERPRFIEKQSSSQPTLQCMICSQSIRKKQPIWTCQACCISLHLRCIKQWIKKTNEDRLEDGKKFLLNWSCIQCKTEYNENMPEYYCFCGKFKNPEFQRDLEPHSCGKPCQRKRGTYCPHLCPSLCHSGKCKPCQYQGSMVKCNCGKTQRMAKCSEQRAAFQCGKRCEKVLKCGKHKCQRNCHYGQCFPCKKKHLVSCYCGKNQDVVDCIQSAYACQSVCDKLLDCGYHKCQKDCHEGPCGSCQKKPQLQKKCPCGKYQLMMISQNQRSSCKDPIPSCGMPCRKKLSCGHQCPKTCHEGRCPDCKVIVQQYCRCGTVHRKIQCWKAKQTKQQFHCDTVCKKKRNCGIHLCNTQCCKFKGLIGPQAHICQLTCQKQLNCQKHTCDLPCHAGNCKKCPVIYSQPQPCPCGATSLKPPIICGTVTPQCDNQCNKSLSCGHKCLQLCHYGQCKCREQVQVRCRCGLENIHTTCGRQALCLNKCQKQLKCGHKCLVQCHAGTCEQAHREGCFKKCDKLRNDCGHKCKQICHFGKNCQEFPCQAEIMIKCQCGNRQATIICGSHGNTDGTHKKKQILCNKKCQNAKRFDIIYKGKQIYYPNALMQYGFKNFNYLQKIQQRLSKFISQSDQNFLQIQFKQFGDHAARIALHNLFQNHYHLNTHFYRLNNKAASFTLTQTDHTMIPKPCLSDYIKQVSKGYVKRTNLPFQYTIKFDGEPRQKAEMILKALKSYIHKYYVERKDKMVLVHFWSKQEGSQAQYYLQNQYQTVNFIGEENTAKIQELQQQVQLDQIVQTQIQKKQEDVKKQKQNKQVKQENKDENRIQKQQVKQTKQENKIQNIETSKPDKKQQQQEKKQSKWQQGKKQTSGQKKQQQNQQNKQQKSKLIIKPAKQSSKLIIRKGAPNFVRSPFPPAKQNVQDLYVIDDDELFNEKVDWDKVVKELHEKKMGIQASQWRIRALLMISTFHKFDQKILRDQFARIIDLYEKDKQKARRILQLQRLQVKKIQQQMRQNQIYLSDHQPQIMSYCILYNYFEADKIQFKIKDQCAQTRQVQRVLQIIDNVEKGHFEEFYNQFNTADYLLQCTLIPFVHEIREHFLKILDSKKKVPVQNLYRYLLFDSEDDLIKYAKQNGLQIGKRMSKSKKIEQFTLIQGQLKGEHFKDTKLIDLINQKRDKRYFLTQAKELVHDKWMTRSFFAFGDFKQSISPKYMLALCRELKD